MKLEDKLDATLVAALQHGMRDNWRIGHVDLSLADDDRYHS